MTKSLQLYFLTNRQNIVTINIPNIKTSLDNSHIIKAMDEILESKVFFNEKGILESKYKASIITKETIKYEIN